MYKKRTKLVAIMLVFMLTITHLSIIGEVFATNLENQETKTNNNNVEFDSYFMDENSRTHSSIKEIGEENYLYTNIKVKQAGYLKNIVVSLENANYVVNKEIANAQIAKVEENKIYYNQIKSGNTAIEIALPIQISYANLIEKDLLNKESSVKLTGTYVDGNGNEKQIEKEITVSLAWKAKKDINLNMQVSKFVPYSINENKGLVLQTVVQSNLKENNLPIKENKIEISVPSINNIKPQEIKVVANTTKASNGDILGENFAKENYTYNKEENKLTITVENTENEQKQISWQKEAIDEFVITYVYSEEALKEITEEGIKLNIKANNQITTYEANASKVEKEFASEVVLKDTISTLVDFTVNTNTQSLSKGQIYANYDAVNKVETNYQETITANVGLAELTDKIVITQNTNNFKTEQNTKIDASDIHLKTITVDKKEINKILGEEGEIKFLSSNKEIAKINKETKSNEEGKFVIDLSTLNINNLIIETSKPQIEGKINFIIEKAINKELTYSKLQMKDVKSIEAIITGKALNGDIEFAEQNVSKEIVLVEPVSNAELQISNSNLSTVVTNENVKLTAILKTDALENNLYQNPTLKITMPNYIEDIRIKNVEVLFDTEGSKLALKTYNVVQNADGTKTIVITLEGKQTEYTLGAISKGVNVVVTTDITINKFTPNKQDQIKMVYTNSNVITRARTATTETNETIANVNIVAPVGIITTSTVSGYKEGAQNITSISNEEKTAIIETIAEARIANFSMEVINNYNNTVDNITILGRTLFKENKNILTGASLGSTMDMPLTSNIELQNVDASKVKIYYSENENANKDLNLSSNGWTLTPANLENVKSYLIVLENHTMNTGDRISFNYSAQIPANLQHNQSAYENYVVYFNNNLETGAVEDKTSSTKVGVTTGKGPVLEANLKSNVNETEEVLTGKFIKYTVTVKNIGEEVAENVVATVNLPKSLNYIEFFEGEVGQYTENYENRDIKFEIGNIKVNETITKEFWTVAKKLETDEICQDETHYTEKEGTKIHKAENVHQDEEYVAQVSSKASITAKDLAKAVETNEVKNTLKNANFILNASTTANGLEALNEGDTFNYNLTVSKYNINKDFENTIVETYIPEGLNYQEAKIEYYNMQEDKQEIITEGISYNEKTRILTINLGKLSSTITAKAQSEDEADIKMNDTRTITVTSKVEKLPEGEYTRTIVSKAEVYANEVAKESSNPIADTISKEAVTIVQSANIPQGNKVAAGEKLTYKFEIKNIGGNTTNNIEIVDNLPKELQYVSTEYTINGQTKTVNNIDENNTTKLIITIEKGQTAEVKINTVAKELSNETKISNVAEISSERIGTIKSNEISHNIEAVDYETIGGDPSTILRRISGSIWKDENADGIKDENEERMANVEVMLFNNTTGKLAIDSSNKELKQKTDANGNYTFRNLKQGSYTVIFLYDNINYSATTYKKENVSEEQNSDAVDSKITIDGIERTAAITEQIVITDSNIYNIDLGLVSNPKFDLKLDKTVKSITVQDNTGTNKYEYNDEKLAKKDLVGKQINNSSIIVEYKIKVTNEGAISGFAKKIADYMPTEMKFNSEINSDWYMAEDGTLYNSSLANTIINPGESKEVTLLLTKKLTENNIGLYNNTAEIYESYNDLGIEDIDSIAGNKVSGEDDISSADVLITVKTGETILFVGLSITIITTIGIGAYFIKKKVLR